MCNKKNTKSVKKATDRDKRNRIERQRDSVLDDGIQSLMCYICMHSSSKKYTRAEILELVYKEGVKMLEKEAAAVATTTPAESTSSCADGKKKENQQNRRKDDDDKNPLAIGQAC